MGSTYAKTLMLTAAVTVAALRCVGSSSMPAAHNLPSLVSVQMAEQVSQYLSGRDLTGLPLLDTSVDWAELKNWPETIKFAGKTYQLELRRRISAEHYLRIPLGRIGQMETLNDIRSEYGSRLPGKKTPIYIGGYWGEDNRIQGKRVELKGQTVFSLALYPGGQISTFAYDEKTTSLRVRMSFTSRGELIGQSVLGGSSGPSLHIWKGERVSRDDFYRNTLRLWTLSFGSGSSKQSVETTVDPPHRRP